MRRTRYKGKLSALDTAKLDDFIRDPRITEEAYQLLAQGASPKGLLTVVTPPAMAEYDARPAPQPHKFKMRNPILDDIAALDAFIAEGLAAGKSVVQLMSEVLPSVAEERAAKAQRIKEDNARADAKRAAYRASLDDPEKRERERKSYQKRQREWKRKSAATVARKEREAEERKQAVAENPTLDWRHPRRKGWHPPKETA